MSRSIRILLITIVAGLAILPVAMNFLSRAAGPGDLLMALHWGKIKAAGELIAGGADLNATDSEGNAAHSSATAAKDTVAPELAISSATVIGSNTDQAITVSGSVSGPEFTESYGDALESAGYTQESTFESGDTINRVYMDDAWTIGVVYFGDASENQVTVSIYSSS